MKFINKEELDYICKLLFTAYKIPITVIDDRETLIMELKKFVGVTPKQFKNGQVEA